MSLFVQIPIKGQSLEELYEVNEDFWGDISKPFPYKQNWRGDPVLLKAMDDAADAIDTDEDNTEYEERYEKLTDRYWREMTHDGAIIICEYGCNLRFMLVVNGDEYGSIWFDKTPDFEGYSAVSLKDQAKPIKYEHWCNTDEDTGQRITFGEWYHKWLDWACKLVESETGESTA